MHTYVYIYSYKVLGVDLVSESGELVNKSSTICQAVRERVTDRHARYARYL